MEKLGHKLKAQRESKGILLEELASSIKVQLSYLVAIEAGEWKKLPPEPFGRGFLSSYARFVDLDPQKVIAQFIEETGAEPNIMKSQMVQDKPRTWEPNPRSRANTSVKAAFPFKAAAAGFGVLCVAGFALWISYIGRLPETPAPMAQAPQEEVKPIAEAAPVASEPERAPAQKPADIFSHELMVESTDRSWVKVVVDDQMPREFFLPAGSKMTEQAQKKIKLVLGNATHAKITHNGEPVTGRQIQPGIVSFTFPAGSTFPQDVPKKKPTAETETD